MSRPSYPVARVVKPPSAKQRANAKRYGTTLVIAPAATASAPSTSWWTGLDRTQLQAQAAAEQPRMASTKFGRLNTTLE